MNRLMIRRFIDANMAELTRPTTIFLAINTVCLFLLTFAYYRTRYNPTVVVFDPTTNIAETFEGLRGKDALSQIHRSAFLRMVRIATCSWPFDLRDPNKRQMDGKVALQLFSPDVAKYLDKIRREASVYTTFGIPKTAFHNEKAVKVFPREGTIFFESHFVQTIPTEGNTIKFRTFFVRAAGSPTPITMDNPHGIKFTLVAIKQIESFTDQ